MLSILFCVACNTNTKKVDQHVSYENEIKQLFGNIDSTQILNAVICSQGIFALVSNKHVLIMPENIYSIPSQEKPNTKKLQNISCKLNVFEDGQSHLNNICTDLILGNLPKSKYQLKSNLNEILIYSHIDSLYGGETGRSYIQFLNLEFKDSIAQEKIILNNKLIWGKLHLGTPG